MPGNSGSSVRQASCSEGNCSGATTAWKMLWHGQALTPTKAVGQDRNRCAGGARQVPRKKEESVIAEAKLTVAGLRARAVNIKLGRPVQTSGGEIPTAPLVLIDLSTEEGVTGRSYVFAYTPL